MKKLIKLLLVSFVILSLPGCSKPNEELPNNENVVGDIESPKENDEDKNTDNNVTENGNISNKDEESNNTSTNKKEPSKDNTVTHTHEWTKVYEIVKHDEIGHYETVVVEEAWDEVIVIQEAWDEKVIDQEYIAPTIVNYNECNRCGNRHGNAMDKCYCGGTFINRGWEEGGQEEISHIVHHDAVTETIHHEAVTERQWFVDQKAYEEKIVAGYKCSKCGDFKQ